MPPPPPKLLQNTVLDHLNDPSTTKKYVGLALAVKLLQQKLGEEEDQSNSDFVRDDDDDVFLSVCQAAMRDDFLFSLISPPREDDDDADDDDSDDDESKSLSQKKTKDFNINQPENMQKRSLGINVCASLAAGSRECALVLLPILEELYTNSKIILPRDSMAKVCEFTDRTLVAVVRADDGSWKGEDDKWKWKDTPLKILKECVCEMCDILCEAFESEEEEERNENEALIVSGIAALNNIVREICLAHDKENVFAFDPYEELDLVYDSEDEASNPYVDIANHIAVSNGMIGRVARECLYKRAGTEAALVALELINTVIDAKILGENDESAKHRYKHLAWEDFESKWSNELREGLKFILSSKSVGKRQRRLAVHVAAYVQHCCGDDGWMLKSSPSSLSETSKEKKKNNNKKKIPGGRVAAAAEKTKNITLFELVSQICRVEMQIEIHHLLESDDSEIRYNASEDLRDNLQNFGTLVRVFTLAIGGGDDEGGDDVDDVTKGLENLDISAEGAMKQLNVIVSVIGSLLEVIGSAENYERLDECGADPFLMFTIADIVARFANELEVVHVGEIDASMKHVAENMRKRLAQIDSSSKKNGKLQYGWDRMESVIYNFNVRIWSTFETADDPERLECQINSGFISLLFEMIADNISAKCDVFPDSFDARTKFLSWVAKYADDLAQDMSRMLVEGWSDRLRVLNLDPGEIERIKKQWAKLTKAVQEGKVTTTDYVKSSSLREKSAKVAEGILRIFEDLDDPKRLDVLCGSL